jgi:hypothetical protein
MVTNIPNITAMRFTIDKKILLTNRGAVSINDESISPMDYDPSIHNSIIVRNDRVQRGNRNYLWLLQEFRADCSAVCGRTLAIGQDSGPSQF